MQKKKKKYTSTTCDIFPLLGEDNPDFTPAPCDYSFLEEEPKFQIGKHSAALVRMLDTLKASEALQRFKVFNTETAEVVARVIRQQLKINNNKRSLIVRSLIPRFATRRINPHLLYDIALLLLGNTNILERDQIIRHDYTFEDGAMWVAVEITNIVEVPDDMSRIKATMFVESGLLAGSTINKTLPVKLTSYILSQIGKARRSNKNARDLFGSKFLVKVDACSGSMEFVEYSVTSSQKAYNKKLFRGREQDRPCVPLDVEVDCYMCRYGVDQCPFAVYKKTQ